MEQMIEKGMDLCFVFDLNPYKDNDELRSCFIYRVNMLMVYLSTFGPGYFVSIYMLDGPYEEAFTKRAIADIEYLPALKQRYFKSLTPTKDCSPHHSYALYEKTEKAIREAQNETPSVSYDTHCFYVTGTPVTRCHNEEHGFDALHEDSFHHLYLLGMDEDEASRTCEDTGCEGFFLYDLNDEGMDDCFADIFHTLKAVRFSFESGTEPIDDNAERFGWYLS